MAYLKINETEAVVINGLDANAELTITQIAYILGMNRNDTKQLLNRTLKKLSSPKSNNTVRKLWETTKINLIPETADVLRGVRC